MKKKSSYVGNVAKEVKQTVQRVSNAFDKADKAAYEKKYGRKLPGKIGSSKIKEQVGQLAGAVLQGRRYDDKTGKQIKTASKSSSRARINEGMKKPIIKKVAAKPATGGAKGTRNEQMKPMRTFKATTKSTPQLPASSKKLGKMTKKAYK